MAMDVRAAVAQFFFGFLATAIAWRLYSSGPPRPYHISRVHCVKDEKRRSDSLTSRNAPHSGTLKALGVQDKLVLVMVGLPARGKSFITRKIIRYLNWVSVESKTFNAGERRRQVGHAGEDASFFEPSNVKSKELREQMAMDTLDELLEWLAEEGQVAVFDATNTTRARREKVIQRCAGVPSVDVIFIESICNDPDILESNYRSKAANADYSGRDQEKAIQDFKQRVAAYEKIYETLEDTEADGKVRYIKIYNVGAKVTARGCDGYLASQVVFFLQNIHLHPRRIYLVRPGENENMKFNVLGLDLGLTDRGHRLARQISQFILQRESSYKGKLLVWGGTAQRVQECLSYYNSPNCEHLTTPLLNELGGGDMEGLTYDEIKKLYPEQYEARQNDKLNYRYPGVGGESYMDVIERLRPLIVELERQRSTVVVVCHKAVMRVFLAYFAGIEARRVPFLESDQDIVHEITTNVCGVSVQEHKMQVDEPKGRR